jgi:hypothetical protein
MKVIDQRVTQLFDFITDHPEGVTWEDISDHLLIDHGQTNRVIRAFRLEFANQSVNLTASPQGSLDKWLYTLDASSEAWAENRIADAESRLETMAAMMKTVVNATNPRSLAGRKARKMEVAFRHLQENLAELVLDGTFRL